MNRAVVRIMALFLVGTVAGCVGPKAAERSAKGKLLQDAERYVTEQREQNKLPGFSSTDHGRLIAATAWHGGTVSYPALVTVRAWKAGEKPEYRYELAKNDQDAPWQLLSATRQDKAGKVVEQLLSK